MSVGSKIIFPTWTMPSSSSTGCIDSLIDPFKELTECVERFDLVDNCELWVVKLGRDNLEVAPTGNFLYLTKMIVDITNVEV